MTRLKELNDRVKPWLTTESEREEILAEQEEPKGGNMTDISEHWAFKQWCDAQETGVHYIQTFMKTVRAALYSRLDEFDLNEYMDAEAIIKRVDNLLNNFDHLGLLARDREYKSIMKAYNLLENSEETA